MKKLIGRAVIFMSIGYIISSIYSCLMYVIFGKEYMISIKKIKKGSL